MPPEPLPWDRKDLFKERKHEKSEAIGSAARWRDSYHGSREFNRWGSADLRRPTGHGKQGGWHQFSEDSSHGYGPSRSFSDRVIEDESFRPSVPRGDGKYIRIGRESRGSFSHRDWRSHSRDTNNGFGNPSRRPSSQDVSSDQRSVDDTVTYSSPQSFHGLENGPRSDVEVSLGSTDWKPLKWSRSGSLSSRGSAYSSSTNSKNEKADLPLRVASPIESPSAEATACVTSSLPSEDTISRKKPRLGWGDGLAKYEKEKVDVPDGSLRKEVALLSSGSGELTHSLGSNFAEKSPKTLPFSDCASPATPSSFACSSSSGLEDKPFSKGASADGMICSSPGSGSQNLQKLLCSIEKMEISSIANLGSSLVELFHSDDPNTIESCFGKSTLNKLLAYKGEISKTLEMTESEIDSLENELKSLKSGNGGNVSNKKSCSATRLVESSTYFKEQDGISCIAPRPAPLVVVSSSDATVEKVPLCKGDMGVEDVDTKADEIDSPGTVTSKFNEPSRVVKENTSDIVDNGHCSVVTDMIVPGKMEGNFPISEPFVDERKTTGSGNECILAKSCSSESFNGDLMAQAGSRSSLCDSIFACNKEYASRAAEVIFKRSPVGVCKISSKSTKYVSCSETEKLIKEKFVSRKKFLKFKESALTLRFKALQQSWKECLLHSVKKCRSRPQKKELSLRVTHSGHQKYRSSFRSRLIQQGACQSTTFNTEIAVRHSSKLLLNPQIKLYRNTLKMPAMILDKKEKMALRFISHNGLVEDPCAVEKERNLINPWTSAEKEIFWEKLSLFGKDFKKISSFLDLKTTADCIQFYYKNHKSDSFKKNKNLELGKQMKSSAITYLVTSGKKWNPDANATSLDILGVASVMAAQAEYDIGNQQKCSRHLGTGKDVESKVSWSASTPNKSNLDDLQTEKETVAADVLAGISGSISSEALSSCITSAIDPREELREQKCYKVDSAAKLPSLSDVMQKTDNEPCSDDSSEDVDSSNWTDEEKVIFLQAVSSYGKDFDMISRCIRSKSRDQCKIFFSKARKCLGLDLMHTSGDVGETPGNGNDISGSGTDTEDHCVVEICGGRGSDESISKSINGVSTSVNINHEESVSAATVNMRTSMEFEGSTALQQLDEKGAEAVGNMIFETLKEEDVPNPSQPMHDQKIEGSSENTEGGKSCNEPDILRSESVSTVDENSAAVSECRATVKLAIGEEEVGSDANLHSQSTMQCSGQDSTGYDSNIALEGSSIGLDPQILHPNILKVEPVEKKSCIKSEENFLAVRNSDTGVIGREQMLNQDVSSSTLVLQDVSDADQKPMNRDKDDDDEHRNNLLRNSESPKFPRSYPFNKQIFEDINRNINHTYFPVVQGLSKPDINCNNKYVPEGQYLQNCNSSKPHNPAELPFLSQNIELGHNHQKNASGSGSASDSDVPRRKGDVKLFGQILSHAPSQQNSSSGSNECGEKKGLHNSSSKSCDMGEHVPLRSYGFWDGSRIQTGLSALPDSAILQSKYPAAFSGYSGTSVKTEQQTLQALANNSDQSLNEVVSAFPTKDGVVDYHSYRSRDGVKMRPFPVDIFSEMHRRNGFDAVSLSSLQQQGRVLVGMNVVGRGGILMGGSCTGVSDPVAAIKMHYAKADQYAGQPGSMFTREDGSWRGGKGGDLGSR
ncbi:Myb_DNA-binding domain-containing protein [Cucumis melo var. makuwa]|uniref:Myb_DNA-binding domain-containing protein n=1 Tax=Cucumis melo var. makuwa TaxID=1194695 RepID=A0A5A7SZU1_CUCMM|nr:Myb_DNA-binding domain-containing protein [Cucumis melo var. makuwa]TYK09288.1 Myb_DNA-binding domain-containing protein [Cucumis melo var. makuwa]